MSQFQIRKVRFRNFLSFGNAWTEIDFSQHSATLIHGKNGAGKSTLYEAIFYGCFGKPFRKIKKGSLANWINAKEPTQVEIEASRGTDTIKILRTVSPSTLKVWINGQLRDQEASNRDPQEWLEKSVIGMSDRTFRQIVVLGSTSYVPFMLLTPGDRRIVVDDILGMGVYAEMLDIAKKRLSAVTKSLNGFQNSLSRIEGRKTALNETLDRLSVNSGNLVSGLQANVEKLTDQLKVIASSGKETANKLEELKKEEKPELIVELRDGYKKVFELRNTYLYSANQSRSQINFLRDNSSCPTCKQDISAELRNTKLSELTVEIEELDAKVEKARNIISGIEERIKPIEARGSQISLLQRELADLITRSKTIKGQQSLTLEEIKRLESIESADLDRAKADVEEANKVHEEIRVEIDKVSTEIESIEAVTKALKDDGVKARIVRDYLPKINSLISNYLKTMGMNVSFKFDEEFSETILVRSRDEYSYENFSTGERLRIDLALLFAWRDIATIRGSSGCGLMVFDEIGGGSLDHEGFSAFSQAIDDARNRGDCVLVVSHQPDLLSDRCDRVLHVAKSGGFSKIDETVDVRQAVLT